MKIALALLVLAPFALQAEVLFESDFDSSLAQSGTPPKLIPHADATASIVVGTNDPDAATATEPGNMALVIQGGDEVAHSWKPAADIAIPGQSAGFLRISFLVRNASLDIGTLGVQVAEKGADGMDYTLFQSLTIYPDHMKVSGTGRHLFKEITSGADSAWHKVVWTIPMPANAGAVPSLTVDAQDQGNIQFDPGSAPSVNLVRFWLTSKRTKDIKFLVDDIKIELVEAP